MTRSRVVDSVPTRQHEAGIGGFNLEVKLEPSRWIRKLFLRPCFLLIGWLVIGCAGIHNPNRSAEIQALKVDAGSLPEEFRLQGRIWFKAEEQKFTGQFSWDYQTAAELLELSSPLGQTLIRIARDGQAVTLETAAGEIHYFENWSELNLQLQKQQVPFVPMRSLRYWIHGVPNPGATTANFKQEEDTISFEQENWAITCDRYATAEKGGRGAFPRRISLQSEAVQLKLWIDYFGPVSH